MVIDLARVDVQSKADRVSIITKDEKEGKREREGEGWGGREKEREKTVASPLLTEQTRT